MKKLLHFIAEIGTIMYVGGILSHIVIGAINPHPAPETASFIYDYKLQSAYILILPGLGMKIAMDLIEFCAFGERAWWMRIKLAMTAFLAINAFVFLVPMMPDLLALAQKDVTTGHLSDAFMELEHKEKLVGMSNVIPLITEMIMEAFRPKLSQSERKA